MHFSRLFQHCPQCGSHAFVQHGEKSMNCESCGFVFYINVAAAVAAFILNEKGELLVCKRAKEPEKGTLDLPGGFVDCNETAEEAVKREIKEELNANVTQAEYLFSLPNEYLYSDLTIPTLDMFFACKLDDYQSLKPSDDVASCSFIHPTEIDIELFGLKSIKKAVDIFRKSLKNN